MNDHTITFDLPENLYLRLQQAAQATQQSFNEIILHAVQIGIPPGWEDIPPEFQADVAALDRLDDAALWRIVRQKQSQAEHRVYQELLDKHANGRLSETEQEQLRTLRTQADRFMIRKAQAAALLRWRGYQLPPADSL
jgi:hypothetical protein